MADPTSSLPPRSGSAVPVRSSARVASTAWSASTLAMLAGAVAVWGGPVVRASLIVVLVVLLLRLAVLVARARHSPTARVERARPALLGAGKAAFALGVIMWVLPRHTDPKAFHWLAVVLLVAVGLDVLYGALAAALLHVDVSAPTDGVVGVRSAMTMATRSPVRTPVWVRMASLHGAPWIIVEPPCCGEYVAIPEHRGVFPGAVLSVSTRGPLGLAAYVCQWWVPLAAPIVVGPARVVTPAAQFLDAARRIAVHQEDPVSPPRGLRAYVPGDAPRRVHWPATAHAGQILVRELERVSAHSLVVVVDLGEVTSPASEIEGVAARAAWLLDEALRRGSEVTLRTLQDDGETTIAVEGPVRTPVDVSRRLATAVPGRGPAVVGAEPLRRPDRGPVLLVDRDGARSIWTDRQ